MTGSSSRQRDGKYDRKTRLGDALRANLKRRKMQARARDSASDAASGEEPSDKDESA